MAFLSGALPLVLFACDAPPSADGHDAAADSGGSDAVDVDVTADAGTITGIDVSPLVLTPAFSSSISDYYVRCVSGDNNVSLTITTANGQQSSNIVLQEDQLLVVAGYSIRCLPHDFPGITVAQHTDVGSPTLGYYLVNGATYAVVLDTNGTPIWYSRGTSIVNVDAPAPNLISMSPNGTGPYGWDPSVRFDLHALTSLATTSVSAVGSATDSHEFRVLSNGDYLLFTYPIEQHVDLTGLGSFGSDENMADCEVQEVDTQGNLVWSWLASDHVDPIKESIEPQVGTINAKSVVDPFHCNSIDVDANGNLLMSFRHANALYYVDRSNGDVVWKVGGSAYNKDGAEYLAVTSDPQGSFNMQHDARFTPNGNITIFDDHGASAGVARGVEYALDHDAGTASVVWQFLGTAQSQYEGSFRRYADGQSVIGWGYVPSDSRVVTEVDANGHDVLDISFSGGPSYRAVKVPPSQLDISLLRATAAK